MEKYELDDNIYEQVTKLSREAEKYFDKGYLEKAITTYRQALELLPEPKSEWEAATWLYAAIGDAYWILAEYQNSFDAFFQALKSPGGIGNPFIHLRVGQLAYVGGDTKKARDEFIRAYMGAGEEIFKSEDGKYFSLIKDLVRKN